MMADARADTTGDTADAIADTVDTIVNTADTTAATADTIVDTADTTADTADTIVNTADMTADTADTIVDTADMTADTADTIVDTADTTAATANAIANTADTMAATADTIVDTADMTAATADTIVDTADTTAATADTIVDTADMTAATADTIVDTADTTAATADTKAVTTALGHSLLGHGFRQDGINGRQSSEDCEWSALDRTGLFDRLRKQSFDLFIIGGGITGAGIALDAQARGMRTAIIDMQDFAAGTSSRSTKLVHGGLRYLKQLDFGVVAEVGKERAIVYENGPHITTPERMLLPIYQGGTFGRLSTSFGLRLYDWLAGVKKRERRRMLSARQTLGLEPLLRQDGLKGGGYYVEYRTDDARLTIETVKKAVELGAVAISYVQAESFRYDDTGRLIGVTVRDRLNGSVAEIRPAKVINAAGPWVDKVREADGSRRGKTLHLTKGVHLVFDRERFPLRQAIYFDAPDGRMIFAIPRDGKTYIGTTDTSYKADIATPRMTSVDLAYLLHAVNTMFPGLALTPRDIESSWAGLRPLIHQEGKGASEISRRDEIFVSPSGLLSIAGGKLTGYRKMAQNVVDKAAALLKAENAGEWGPSRTRTLPLSGGDAGGSTGMPKLVRAMTTAGTEAGLPAADAERLARRYGSNAPLLFALAPACRAAAAASGMPLALLVQLHYAVRYEMAVKPADFWIRRTGALLFDRALVLRWKDAAADVMARLLGWPDDVRTSYAAELEAELHSAVTPVLADGTK